MKKTIGLSVVVTLGALFIWSCGGSGSGPNATVTGFCTGIASYGLNVTSATANHTGTGIFNVIVTGSVKGGAAGQTAALTFKQQQRYSPSTFPLNTGIPVSSGSVNFNALYQTTNPNSSNLYATAGEVSFSSYDSTTVGGLVAGKFTGLTFSGVSLTTPVTATCTLNGSFSANTGNPAAPFQ